MYFSLVLGCSGQISGTHNAACVFVQVETVGDCYVAAVGIPTPRRDHAVVMSKFARDCMYAMWRLSKELEVTLGPESGHLAMRMGIHSGPVTAGILRGDRARFQLFGDTMVSAYIFSKLFANICHRLYTESLF